MKNNKTTNRKTILVAVSGGVDSMVMLHQLAASNKHDLVVAHFDHGVRPDSAADAEFVRQTAKRYKVPFELGKGRLGASASESKARHARYSFLRRIQKKHSADTIAVAHHLDDEIETAIINLLRGTGRRGLTAMRHNSNLWRPLLDTTKSEILSYAKKHHIKWREDSTNTDTRYLRNYVRHILVPKLATHIRHRDDLLLLMKNADIQNRLINSELDKILKHLKSNKGLVRQAFISLPHIVAQEVMLLWLRQHNVTELDKPTIERLVIKAKTAHPGTRHNIRSNTDLHIEKTHLLVR